MIKSIQLKNIQSHKETTLQFDKGINCIIGSSNNGKTTIIRALNWVRYNRPLGIDTLASHWIVNDKGALKDELSVTIENDNGTVTRKRTKTENQYIVNGKELNVVKSDVPTEVEDVLKLTETNIQNQQDAPFLLSATSGKVAEYLNRIVRLDMIDKVLSNAESKRRKVNQEIETTNKLIDEDEKKLNSFDWLEVVERLIGKYERIKAKNESLKAELNRLSESVNQFELASKRNYDFSLQSKYINKLNKLFDYKQELVRKANSISYDLNVINNMDIYPDFSKQKKILEKLGILDSATFDNKNKLSGFIKDIESIDKMKSDIEKNNNSIKEYKKQLPKICPICHRPYDFCKELLNVLYL